jgi:hypothetical protein
MRRALARFGLVALVMLAGFGCDRSSTERPLIRRSLDALELQIAHIDVASEPDWSAAADPSALPEPHASKRQDLARVGRSARSAKVAVGEPRLLPSPASVERKAPVESVPAAPDPFAGVAPAPIDAGPPAATVPAAAAPPLAPKRPAPRLPSPRPQENSPVAIAGAVGVTGLGVGIVGFELAREHPSAGAFAASAIGLAVGSASFITTGILLAAREPRRSQRGVGLAVHPGSVDVHGAF